MKNHYNKDSFKDFLETQIDGKYNVLDPRACKISGLNKSTYLDIVKNYDEYYRLYIKDTIGIKR